MDEDLRCVDGLSDKSYEGQLVVCEFFVEHSLSNWGIVGEWTLVTLLLSPDHCTPV